MPIPHQEMRRIIKRRIQGLEGTERLKVLQTHLDMFPGYYQGPYGELRKWVLDLMDETKLRKAVKHQDQWFIPKEGGAQVVLVGPPNAGKSSLLKALTGRQVAVGDYPFTTLRPVAGMVAVGGAVIQLVDLPGLIDGAVDGKGGGRALLGAVRMADAILFATPLTEAGIGEFRQVYAEVAQEAEIDLPCALVGTKQDIEGSPARFDALVGTLGGIAHARCSVATGQGLDDVKQLIWDLCGLVRVFCKPRGKAVSPHAMVLPPGGTVQELVEALNRAWLKTFAKARVTGPSAKFPGQPVGLDHMLADGDVVELILR